MDNKPSNPDYQYHMLLQDIKRNGVDKGDRTGTGTRSVFGRTMRFDISGGKIPLLTTKKIFTKGIIGELIWMLSGNTNIRYLKENGISIWDSWIKPETAEYVQMTVEEMRQVLNKHLGKEALVHSTMINDPELNTGDCSVSKVETGDDLSVYYFIDYVNNDDKHPEMNIKLINVYSEIYRYVFGEEPRKLVAGDLPHIYQYQWRHWNDTRIINSERIKEFTDRGFTLAGELGPDNRPGIAEARTSTPAPSVVVTREVDQIKELIHRLKNNSDCRRLIVSAWNAAETPEDAALASCHALFQCWTRELSLEERLNLLSAEDRKLFPDYIKDVDSADDENVHFVLSQYFKVPARALSLQMYQRS